MQIKASEKDMYPAIKAFFEGHGYDVRGEVLRCDLAAVKGGELVIVELKTSFNISLLYQAIDRKTATNAVYIALPRKALAKNHSKIKKILSKLEIGLISVAMDSPTRAVEVLLPPGGAAKGGNPRSRALMAELKGRTFDGNTGGSNRQKLVTASRERHLHIACALEHAAGASPAYLVKNYNCHKSAGQMLNRNYYGWFNKVAKGVYELSEQGRLALCDPVYKKFVDFYRNEVNLNV